MHNVTCFTCNTWNVIYDPQDQLFKCWYEDWGWSKWIEARSQDGALLLAVSRNGVKWDKPGSGIRKLDGRDENDWDRLMITCGSLPVTLGDETLAFYTKNAKLYSISMK